MRRPNLTLSASSSEDLFAQLRSTDIAMPLVTKVRTKEHREQYLMARFLATIANSGRITFPINVVHSEKPDFLLHFASTKVSVECTEAVPEELYEIEILREKHYPEAMNFSQMFLSGERSFTWDEKHKIARGSYTGSPWMLESSKKNWIKEMLRVISKKTEKLQTYNYLSTDIMWLLIQDEWPTSLHFHPQQLIEAAIVCSRNLTTLFTGQIFHTIFIASGNQLLCFERSQVNIEEIHDLWK